MQKLSATARFPQSPNYFHCSAFCNLSPGLEDIVLITDRLRFATHHFAYYLFILSETGVEWTHSHRRFAALSLISGAIITYLVIHLSF